MAGQIALDLQTKGAATSTHPFNKVRDIPSLHSVISSGTMDIIETTSALRERLAIENSISFVPTMGNLHEGHYGLMRLAREHGRCVVASVFVNRLQFGPAEDFDRYPRTFGDDCAGLEREGVDVLFAPTERELYPERQKYLVDPGPLGSVLEGEFRPGFFRGVCTVVLKLFNIVRPQAAIFGKKDRQQLRIIEHMVRQLALEVRIVSSETARAPDGLALSSRNGYLSTKEREEAPRLFHTLKRLAEAISTGNLDYARLEQQAIAGLAAHGWRADYVAVRDHARLEQLPVPLTRPESGLLVLGAAWLGRTRLIDNVEVDFHRQTDARANVEPGLSGGTNRATTAASGGTTPPGAARARVPAVQSGAVETLRRINLAVRPRDR